MIFRVLFVACFLTATGCDRASLESGRASPQPSADERSVVEGLFAVEDQVPDRSLVEVQPIEFHRGEGPPAYSPDAIALVVEPLQPAVLPYQAALVRVSLVNRTDGVVGPVADVNGFCYRNGKAVLGSGHTLTLQGSFGAGYFCSCIMLGPRQRLSVDIALSHTSEFRTDIVNQNRNVSETVIDPLFFADAECALEASYNGVVRQPNNEVIGCKFSLRLAEPTGDDRACFERIQGDGRLARCLYDQRSIPDSAHIVVLEEIVAAWPNSSYADYARLALARARIGPFGERLPTLRRPWAVPAEGVRDRPANADPRVIQRQISPLLPATDASRITDRFDAAGSQPFRERFVVGIQTQARLTASLDERRQATALLDGIRSRMFPFAGHAMLLKHRIAEIDEPERLASFSAALDRDRPLAREWLQLLGEHYDEHSPPEAVQAWVAYRIQTSNSPGKSP